MAYLNYEESLTLFDGIQDVTPVTIPLPEPPNKNKIENLKKPAEKQKFELTPLPKKFATLPLKDQEEFIYKEWDKRINGMFFMNNGKLTYITGAHYFYLNWWKNKWGRAIFCIPEWHRFVHWNYRIYDPTSFGICEMTARQVTKSSFCGLIGYELASSHRNFHAGIQSKTDDDAEKFFKDKIVYGWRGLPEFFKPKADNSSNPKSELIFAEPASRAKGSQKVMMADELTSKIDYQAALDSAYDGQTLDFYIDDEASKLESNFNVRERWEVVKQAMYDKLSSRVRGKSIHTSTVELMEKKGGKQWKRLWLDSREKDEDGKSLLQPNGQTISGLHQHFTPAYMWGHYDEWGYPDIERNKAEIEAERKNRKGENRASIIRKKPNTIKECFTLSGKDCFFNSDILDVRLETFVFGNKYLTKGNFQWKEGMKDGFVEFLPSEKGRFNLSYLFDKPEKSNQFTIMGGIKVPSNIDKFRAGADPFRLDVTKDSRNSKFGFGVFMLRDWAIDNPSVAPYEIDGDEIKINHITERFCCTYEHRPPTLSEACEDILMACVYFGCQVFPELNVDYVQRYFQQRGYAGYLLHKQNDRTGKHDENAGDTTTAALKTDIYTWYFDHVERNGMREVHDDLLRQLREIDNDMTDYDLFVGCGYAGLASKKVGEAQNHAVDLADIFPDYV